MDHGIFDMQKFRMGGSNQGFHRRMLEAFDRSGLDSIDRPYPGAGFLVFFKSRRIFNTGLFRRDKEFHRSIEDLQGNAFNGNNLLAVSVQIVFVERYYLLKGTAAVPGTKNSQLETAGAFTDTGSGIAAVTVASGNIKVPIISCDHIPATEPETGLIGVGLDDRAGLMLIDQCAGKCCYFFVHRIVYHSTSPRT